MMTVPGRGGCGSEWQLEPAPAQNLAWVNQVLIIFLFDFVFTTFDGEVEEELLVGRPPENKERQANDISADDKFLHEGSKQKSVK